MGLHLPQAPPADSEDELDPEVAAVQVSNMSIPMDAGKNKGCVCVKENIPGQMAF